MFKTNNSKEELKEDDDDEYDCSYEINNWDELDLNTDLLRGIYAYGFEKPSPIQCKSIKPIIMKKDILAQAQSGTGKTAAFTIGALSIVNLEIQDTQVLILSPTRELSIQTSNVVTSLGCMMKGLKVQTLFGGTYTEDDYDSHFKKISPHVICGCPGRIQDMIRRDKINTSTIKLVILDEADELLSSGFKEQIYNIFQSFNSEIQVALFTATLPSYIDNVVEKIMRNPVKIFVKAERLTLEGISQYFVAVEDDKQKYATLKDLYSYISMSQCIIYCNSVKRVSDLYEAMHGDGFPVCCIHSNMDKLARSNSFNEFKTGKFRVLISSNVTSRGIDIQQVSTVINFDIPKCVHNYIHRIGRSGRWGRKGLGINFITRRDVSKLKEIEGHYACQINELPSSFDNLCK
jgi:superfamily II DNA/RNA helicase